MLISCPKCRSVYNISPKRLPENGKKFKCAECGEIWMVYPSAALDEETEGPQPVEDTVTDSATETPSETETQTQTDAPAPESQENINEDINIMFNHLSRNTKNLFASGSSIEEMSWKQKIHHFIINNLSLYMLTAVLLIAAVVLGAYVVRDYRYRIVASVPWMENLYNRFKVESMYRGKDIKIEDVNIKEISEKGQPYLEVSGRLHNVGGQIVRLLPVKVSVVNKFGEVEDEIVEILPEHKIEADFSVLFRVLLDYPSDTASKIRISLVDAIQNFNE